MEVKRRKALATSVALSVLFLIVYGGCNWVTGRRAHVGTLLFPSEIEIPFVPFFILPYMSIDLFFVGAPFLCQTNRELSTFAKRVTAAILIAGICFLLFPLRFAFPRPDADGWLGAVFNWFRGIDAPFNQLPSLHVTLMLILSEVYIRHTTGPVRAAIIVWFVLIALSPILTYQHHMIDIAGGVMLAAICFWVFREQDLSSPQSRPAS